MSFPRRAVIAVTSATAPLHDGNPTGLFISEALHPFQVLKEAGFEVDLVSEEGTYVPDWLSQQEDFLKGADKKQWEDLNGEFRKKLDNMPNVHSISGKNVRLLPCAVRPVKWSRMMWLTFACIFYQYRLFFASAGHAALIDYPHAGGLQAIATEIWTQGGVIAAV